MSTKEIVTSMIDVLNEEQLNEVMIYLQSFMVPNDRLEAAMEEADRIINDPNVRAYNSPDELFRELDEEILNESEKI